MTVDNERTASVAEIRRWLLERLRSELDAETEIDPGRALADYGLQSVIAIQVTGELEDRLGLELDPTIFFDYPTVDQLATFLEEELEREQ